MILQFLLENQDKVFIYMSAGVRLLILYIFSLTGAFTKEYIDKDKDDGMIGSVRIALSSVLPSLLSLSLYNIIVEYLNLETVILFSFMGGLLVRNFLETKMKTVDTFTEFLKSVSGFLTYISEYKKK